MSNAASHALFARLKENRVKKTKVSAALSAFVKSLAISVFLSVSFLERTQEKLGLQLPVSWLFFLKELKINVGGLYLFDWLTSVDSDLCIPFFNRFFFNFLFAAKGNPTFVDFQSFLSIFFCFFCSCWKLWYQTVRNGAFSKICYWNVSMN